MPDHVVDFLRASVNGPLIRAVTLLAEHPEIGDDPRAAGLLGDVERVRRLLAEDPGAALRPVEPWGWPPLRGVCSSRWHRDPNRAAGLLAIAELLLAAGATADAHTLYCAAGCANNPGITALLLSRGAVPEDHTVYLTAFHGDHECLRLLLPHADLTASTALAAPISTGDTAGVRLLLEAGVDPATPLPADLMGAASDGPPVDALAAAVEADCDVELVALLLAHGADPNTAWRTALRNGRNDLTELLTRHGAVDDATDGDRLLAACLAGDRATATRLAGARPAEGEGAALIRAADAGAVEAVRLMLDLGFDVHTAVGQDGATPLHAAAGAGSPGVTRLLLERGADLAATDSTWHSPPVDWAVVGSGLRLGRNPEPDWVTTVQVLIDAGAALDDVTIGGDKPPSPEVADLLRAHGVS